MDGVLEASGPDEGQHGTGIAWRVILFILYELGARNWAGRDVQGGFYDSTAAPSPYIERTLRGSRENV